MGAMTSVPPDGSSDSAQTVAEVRRQRMAAYDEWMHLPIVLAATLPIVVGLSGADLTSAVSIIVNVGAWLIFVIDLGVHMWMRRGYLRTRVGLLDLGIVILTAPWFLIPGFGESQILVIARLARLVRLFYATPAARRAVQRLGMVGLFAGGMLLLSSWLAYSAERATNPEFATFGDALWWGIVTLTTVGYGDIVPETVRGRTAGVFLMVTGIATLGILSGTMASLFRSSSPSPEPEPESESEGTEPDAAPAASVDAELAAVRDELAAIAERLAALGQAAGGHTP
jgi:voltage-gated potassium channel